MRRLLLAAVCGLSCAAACVVPSFDVDPSLGAAGGKDTTGGKASGGDTSGANTSGGKDTTGGKATIGGQASADSGAGGRPDQGGAPDGSAGADLGGAGPIVSTPTRVGYSLFHDSAAGADDASSKLPDATFAKPPGTQEGDFILVFFGSDHSLTHLSGSELAAEGWTLQDQHHDYGTDGQATYLLYKFASASEPDSIIFAGINPAGAGNGVQGLLSVYRGVQRAAPINAYETQLVPEGSDTSAHVVTPTPSITTSREDCLLIAGLSPDTAVDAPTISAWPDGFDENRVSVVNPPAPYPYGWANIYSAERPQTTAATLPASSFGWDMTYGGTSYYGALSFVIALAPP